MWKMRDREKEDEFRVMAAMHGVKIGGKDEAERDPDVKTMDKNEVNKKAAQRLMMFGGSI